MTGIDLFVQSPAEWQTAPWAFMGRPMLLQVAGIDGDCAYFSGVLEDGTNLHVLIHPGGQRLLRCSPHTDWAIEERYTGDPLDNEPLRKLQRSIFAATQEGLAAAKADPHGLGA